MTQQQTDRELVVKRLRDRFLQNDFGAKDPVLSELDPHYALKLLAEAMVLEKSYLSGQEKSIKWKVELIVCPVLSSMIFYIVFNSLFNSEFMTLYTFSIFLSSAFSVLIRVHSRNGSIQNAKKAIPDLARHVCRQEVLSSLLVLRSFLDPESDRNAYNTVEAAIYRVLMQTKGVASVPLSETQREYLRELLQRSRQKDEVVVALLLLLASARDVKVMPIAAELARSAPSEHVRTVAAEVYQELR